MMEHKELHNDRGDVVWSALESLRDRPVVAEARAYAADLAERRTRRQRLWSSLSESLWPRVAAGATAVLIVAVVAGGPTETIIATEVGEMRTATLADGSTVTLDTDTQMLVSYEDDEREIRLTNGQARFDVVHDRARPFRVTAGGMTVTAVGTAFNVAALPSRTAVTLIEGRVLVDANAPAAGRLSHALLQPGEHLKLAPNGTLRPKRTVKLDSEMAWQASRVDLSDMTFTDAIAEVNRYSETKIVLDNPSLAGKRVSGIFRAGDVEAVAAALCSYFDLKIVRRSRSAIVLG